ncbi:MAG: hypothetical protein ACLFQQ_01245 [Desulfococcaceae bacterium]
MIEERGEISTTNQYWDCECEREFIHPIECPECLICGAVKEEQPDSRVNELFEIGFSLQGPDMCGGLIFTAKRKGIAWLAKNIKMGWWPEDYWRFLTSQLTLNVYVDNGKKRATIFWLDGFDIVRKNPIEVI